MHQLIQDLSSSTVAMIESSAPVARPGHVLIATRRSLMSAGLEGAPHNFSRKPWLANQPDKARMVIERAMIEGLMALMGGRSGKLAEPMAPGYCNVGQVIDVGAGVTQFQVGDPVVSNGRHAEVVVVPQHLCARIPDGVSDDVAAFTVLAAMGLQGIRLANPTRGETVVIPGNS